MNHSFTVQIAEAQTSCVLGDAVAERPVGSIVRDDDHLNILRPKAWIGCKAIYDRFEQCPFLWQIPRVDSRLRKRNPASGGFPDKRRRRSKQAIKRSAACCGVAAPLSASLASSTTRSQPSSRRKAKVSSFVRK
jgi:hypothetical protein